MPAAARAGRVRVVSCLPLSVATPLTGLPSRLTPLSVRLSVLNTTLSVASRNFSDTVSVPVKVLASMSGTTAIV